MLWRFAEIFILLNAAGGFATYLGWRWNRVKSTFTGHQDEEENGEEPIAIPPAPDPRLEHWPNGDKPDKKHSKLARFGKFLGA